MTIDAVRSEWSLYVLLIKIMFASLNGEIALNSPSSPIAPFPKDKRRWPRWAIAAAFNIDLRRTLALTDAALRNVVAALQASEHLAALVTVPAPTETDIDAVVANLTALSSAIRDDQRFHAALTIGVALAGAIETANAAA